MPKVFVVQDPGLKDISDAKKFGKLDIVTTYADYRNPLEFIIDKIHEKLSSYKTSDYILLIGNPIAIGITMTIAAENSEDGHVKLLVWDKKNHRYEEKGVRIWK